MKKKTGLSVKKMVLTAMFACLAFVLNVCISFPNMAPFQHFVNVMASVFLGPWYGFVSALICGVMRVTLVSSRIGAITGAIFGPIISGLLYRRTEKIWTVFVGEVIGTGFLGAVASYCVNAWLLGLEGISLFYYIPFYTPSAVVGAAMGVAVLGILKRSGTLGRMLKKID